MLCSEESRVLLHGAVFAKRHRLPSKLNITHGLVHVEYFYGAMRLTPRGQLIYLYLIYRGKFLYVSRILKQSLRLLSDLQGTNQIIYIGEAMATHVVLDAVDNLSGHGGIHEVVRTDFNG